ncbi:unnamed protein product [Spirodela intermedia]|uniref:Uncharacterized protein n=1 Tax=Spirodela intermedia TaxID=51605 RepID=A0A7I8LK20_SPIIN|nr:unnamed protein product [Spirodela intermedia]
MIRHRERERERGWYEYLGLDFNDELTALHGDGLISQDALQVVEHLLGLSRTKPRLCILVVPNQGALLHFDRRPISSLRSVLCPQFSHSSFLLHLHHCPVVVQEDGPAPGPLVGRDYGVHMELPKARIECDDPEAEAQPDAPAPPPEVVLAAPLQVLQEAPRPVGDVVGADVPVMLLVAELLLGLVHGDGLVHGLRGGFDVPGVDPDCPAEGGGAPDELGNCQHTLLRLRAINPLPADDVLVGGEVHPVPHCRHDDALCNGVVGDPLAVGERAVDVHHRLVVLTGEGVVDPLAALLNLPLDLVQVPPSASTRVGDLNQDGIPLPARVKLQHQLEGQQFQVDPLEDVQISGLQQPHVDPHRHNLDPHRPPKVFQADVPPLRFVLQPQHPAAAGEEMPSIVEGVEADEIGVEQGLEDLLPDGERPVDLRRREGAVEEESHPEPVESPPQEGWNHHQMIVVNPDVVVLGVDHLDHLLGEYLVGGDVGLPEGSIEAPCVVAGEGEHVVEERPEVLLAEAARTSMSSGKPSLSWKRTDSSSQEKLHPLPSPRRLALTGRRLATMMIRSWEREDGTSEARLLAWSSSSSDTTPGTVITRGSRFPALPPPPPPPTAGKFPDARSRRFVYDLDIIFAPTADPIRSLQTIDQHEEPKEGIRSENRKTDPKKNKKS